MSDTPTTSGAALWDCVLERQRQIPPRWSDRPITTVEVWHVAPQRGRTQDFCPIRCHDSEGITLPGPIQRRTPTCPECRSLVGAT